MALLVSRAGVPRRYDFCFSAAALPEEMSGLDFPSAVAAATRRSAMEAAASDRPERLQVGLVTRCLTLGEYLVPSGLDTGHGPRPHLADVVPVLGIARRFPHLEFEWGHDTPLFLELGTVEILQTFLPFKAKRPFSSDKEFKQLSVFGGLYEARGTRMLVMA
jgi:hypothetical protein